MIINKSRVEELEEENARLRVKIDELIGEVLEWQHKAKQYEAAWKGEQNTSDILRAQLYEERTKHYG